MHVMHLQGRLHLMLLTALEHVRHPLSANHVFTGCFLLAVALTELSTVFSVVLSKELFPDDGIEIGKLMQASTLNLK